MSQSSPKLALPYIQPAQAQKHVTHNEAIERLDMLTQLAVISFDAETPPSDPAPGDTYALGANPNGEWEGYPNTVTMHTGSGWMFIQPQTGWRATDATPELRIWNGTAWAPAFPEIETLPKLGINAGADDHNKLTVSADASLFNNAGNGHQIKVNKAAAGDTASLLFQSGWTGHAEMGLAGDTSFSVKVSPNGGGWYNALKIDPTNHSIELAPNGTTRITATDGSVQIDAPVTGAAVQADATDNTTGKLLKTGAFGLGAPGAYLSDLSVIDGSIAPGLYRADGSSNGAPMASGHHHILHTRRAAGQGEAQLAMAEDTGHMFYRTRGTGNWQGWQQVATSSHYTGDLSNPDTKPIFERGDNASGEYTRLADGTQLCWQTMTLSFDSDPQLDGYWTFPAAFAQPAKVFASIDHSSLSSAQAQAISTLATDTATATGAQLRLIRAAGQASFVSGDSVTVSVLAFGRWS